MKQNIEDFPISFIHQNYESLIAQGVDIPEHMKPLPENDYIQEVGTFQIKQPANADDRPEKKLQQDVETWLGRQGYRKRTPPWMHDTKHPEAPSKGWQLHFYKTQKNPLMLDITLMGNDGRYLEFELKVAGGSLEPHQGFLVEYCGNTVCWNFGQVKRLVLDWEAAGTKFEPPINSGCVHCGCPEFSMQVDQQPRCRRCGKIFNCQEGYPPGPATCTHGEIIGGLCNACADEHGPDKRELESGDVVDEH